MLSLKSRGQRVSWMKRLTLFILTVFLWTCGYELAVADIPRVVVLGLFKDRAIVKIDDKQHTLKAGKSGVKGVKLISASSTEAVLEVAGERQTFYMGSDIGTPIAGPDKSEVTIMQDRHGMYLADGQIQGHATKFIVDTGATYVSINRDLAKQLGIDYQKEGEKSRAVTASGTVDAYRVKLRDVTVGEIKLQDVDALVVDNAEPRKPLLGMSFIKRVDMRHEDSMLVLTKKW